MQTVFSPLTDAYVTWLSATLPPPRPDADSAIATTFSKWNTDRRNALHLFKEALAAGLSAGGRKVFDSLSNQTLTRLGMHADIPVEQKCRCMRALVATIRYLDNGSDFDYKVSEILKRKFCSSLRKQSDNVLLRFYDDAHFGRSAFAEEPPAIGIGGAPIVFNRPQLFAAQVVAAIRTRADEAYASLQEFAPMQIYHSFLDASLGTNHRNLLLEESVQGERSLTSLYRHLRRFTVRSIKFYTHAAEYVFMNQKGVPLDMYLADLPAMQRQEFTDNFNVSLLSRLAAFEDRDNVIIIKRRRESA